MCNLIWTFRESNLLNVLSQWSHWYDFSPVWVRICIFNVVVSLKFETNVNRLSVFEETTEEKAVGKAFPKEESLYSWLAWEDGTLFWDAENMECWRDSVDSPMGIVEEVKVLWEFLDSRSPWSSILLPVVSTKSVMSCTFERWVKEGKVLDVPHSVERATCRHKNKSSCRMRVQTLPRIILSREI